MKHGTLQDALEAEGWLGFAIVLVREFRGGFFQEFTDFLFELVKVAAAGPQDLDRRRIAEQGIEQMLNCHELVVLLSRFLECEVEGKFQFFAQHVNSS